MCTFVHVCEQIMPYGHGGRAYANPHQQVYAGQGPHVAIASPIQTMARYPSPSPYNQRPQSLTLDGHETPVDALYQSPVPTPQMATVHMYRRPPGYYSSQGSPAQSPHGQVSVCLCVCVCVGGVGGVGGRAGWCSGCVVLYSQPKGRHRLGLAVVALSNWLHSHCSSIPSCKI